jgi:hypothetical protein
VRFTAECLLVRGAASVDRKIVCVLKALERSVVCSITECTILLNAGIQVHLGSKMIICTCIHRCLNVKTVK